MSSYQLTTGPVVIRLPNTQFWPTSALPEGIEPSQEAIDYDLWLSLGNTPFPATKTEAEIKKELMDAVQRHLDSTAQMHGYDSMLSLVSYAMDTHLPYSREGNAALVWRGAVWNYCYDVLIAVQNNIRSVPTAAELISELPVLVWPV